MHFSQDGDHTFNKFGNQGQRDKVAERFGKGMGLVREMT